MSPLLPASAVRASKPVLARLGANHGYRFSHDSVRLHAMFTVLDAAAHAHAWSLQLWACPQSPTGANPMAGHLVAEAPLPPISEIADDAEGFAVNALATPPAGGGEHVLVLALVSRSTGSGAEVQDFAAYPRRERFFQPQLGGTVAYRVENDRVQLAVERLENPRSASNVSGSLALELWALPGAYDGGAFQGFPLAGVAFDAIHGDYFISGASFDLPFVAPPAGAWQLALMLREWTPLGFVTRDFRNFPTPFQVESPAPTPRTEAKATPAVAPAPAVTAPKPTAAKNAKASQKTAQPTPIVSVNTTPVDELAGVKGVSRPLAQAIVADRPYRSFTDLLRVKGMGPKLLAKLRPGFRL